MTISIDRLDIFDVGALLTDDERIVRDSVARFVDKEGLPIIGTCFAAHRVRMALDIARDCPDMLGGAGITVEHAAIRHM